MSARLRLLAAYVRHYLTWCCGGYRPPKRARFATPASHAAIVTRLQQVMRSSTGPVMTRKRGSGHEARARRKRTGASVDIRPLNRVLAANREDRTVLVEPQLTMAQLVELGGRFDLAPAVMPEFPEITVGGAIQGLAAESSSHQWGLFHESVVCMEIILGDGSLMRISRTRNPDLFAALPGSYGSLAILTAVKLKMVRRGAALNVQHRRMSLDAFLGDNDLPTHDFLDAICDRDLEVVATVADWVSETGVATVSHRPRWFDPYYSDTVMATRTESEVEQFEASHYAFRYDRGAFWVAPTKLGRSFPSRVIWGSFATAANLYRLRRSKRALTSSPSTRIVQDCIVPLDRCAAFVGWLREHVSGPLWLLPITSGCDNLFGLSPGQWINVGIYVRPDLPEKEVPAFNSSLEHKVAELGGRKTLHADLFCSKEEFESLYDMQEYRRLRQTCHAEGRFADITEKLGIGDGH